MRPMPQVLIWSLFCLLSTFFAPRGIAAQPKRNALTARQILDRMAKTYAECKSYRDSGLVKTIFFQADGKRTVEKPFTTAFVRPDRFRFEYNHEKDNNRTYRYIVWRKGKEVQTWWDVTPGIQKPESLSLALSGATGVSSGSAHTVPVLLLPDEVGGGRITDMTQTRRIEDAKFEKVECFRIESENGKRNTMLWIDKKTFLLRRIDERKGFDNFRTERMTTYGPVIDKEIPEELLEFNPPEQK